MSEAKPKRIVLLDRPFQIRLVAEFVLVQALLTLVFALALYAFTRSELQANLLSAHASYRSTAQMLMPLVAVLAVFNILLATVLVLGYVVHLTHRIARPLLRVRASLEELARRRIFVHTGVLPGDQLFELSASLRKGLETLRTDLHGLEGTSRALRDALEADDLEGAKARLGDLEKGLAAWERDAR